jgi:putative acetyltransferase
MRRPRRFPLFEGAFETRTRDTSTKRHRLEIVRVHCGMSGYWCPENQWWRAHRRSARLANPKIVIRSETDADQGVVGEVIIAAFTALQVSNHTEQLTIEALRAANAPAVSLVADVDGLVIGHIAFSPLAISHGTQDRYGLGPVSVLPRFRRRDVGKALMREGLTRLNDMGAQGCCLVGHPDYHKRFGFKNIPGLPVEGVPQEVYFALSFGGHTQRGTVVIHEGFKADDGNAARGGTAKRA